MRTAVFMALLVILGAGLGLAQQNTQPQYWKGKFQVFQYNFLCTTATDRPEDTECVRREVELWKYDYDLYQNPQGIAREELTHMNRNRSVEGPLDFRLLDYKQGYRFAWDKSGDRVIKDTFNPPVTGRSAGSRRILGFTCDGTDYRWTTFQQSKIERQSWSARSSDFKVPLLVVEYFTRHTGEMLSLTIEVVSQIEAVPDLPASLFEPPPDLQVVEFPRKP